jgi:hypothetical protein
MYESFGSPTSVAGAFRVCFSLVALRRRLSAVLPLSRPPCGGADNYILNRFFFFSALRHLDERASNCATDMTAL